MSLSLSQMDSEAGQRDKYITTAFSSGSQYTAL